MTREAIDTYLKESRDGNLIHRGEAAVVPGFLMVNRLLEGYGGCDAASVVFISLSGAGKRQDWWNRKQESIAGL